MKIDISKQNPYDAVCDVIRELTRTKEGCESLCDRIVRLRTTILGESNELLLVEDMDYCWQTDWYEGGEVELLGFIDLDDVDVPLIGGEDVMGWFTRKKHDEQRNPDGLTWLEFLDKHKNIPHLADICWYFGIQPDELRTELKMLMEGSDGRPEVRG